MLMANPAEKSIFNYANGCKWIIIITEDGPDFLYDSTNSFVTYAFLLLWFYDVKLSVHSKQNSLKTQNMLESFL